MAEADEVQGFGDGVPVVERLKGRERLLVVAQALGDPAGVPEPIPQPIQAVCQGGRIIERARAGVGAAVKLPGLGKVASIPEIAQVDQNAPFGRTIPGIDGGL